MQSNNQDVIQLITSLSLLMGQMQNQKGKPHNQNSFNNNTGHQGHQGGQQRMQNGQNNYRPKPYFNQNPVMPGPQQTMANPMPLQQPMQYGNNQRVVNPQMMMGQNTMPMPPVRGNMNMPAQVPQNSEDQAPAATNDSQRYRNEIMNIFMG